MATASLTSIPRFLLPLYGSMWRRVRPSGLASTVGVAVRYASNTTKGKPIVLEKPTKFNPPSHGSKLPKKNIPRHYGGALSEAEFQAQKVKDYPGMMAPEGTTAHWIWNKRTFHLVVTLGSLTGLAAYTFVENFKHNSPFADMVPIGSDFASHPFSSMRTLIEVVRLTEAHRSAEVAEKRKRRVDDVVKRSEYRKAHGLDKEGGIGSWTAKTDAESLGPAVPVGNGSNTEEDGKRKKLLGIF